MITLAGNAVEYVTVNTSYADPGATATDYLNRVLTNIMVADNIDLSMPGTYHIGYSVTDAAGNKDSATRVVNVVDDIAPTLTLIGNDTITREVFSFINDPGYTVSDNFHAPPLSMKSTPLGRVMTVAVRVPACTTVPVQVSGLSLRRIART